MKWKAEAAALPELSAMPAHPRSASQGQARGESRRAPVQQGPQLLRGPTGAPEEGAASHVQHVVCLVAGDAGERQTPEGRRKYRLPSYSDRFMNSPGQRGAFDIFTIHTFIKNHLVQFY